MKVNYVKLFQIKIAPTNLLFALENYKAQFYEECFVAKNVIRISLYYVKQNDISLEIFR